MHGCVCLICVLWADVESTVRLQQPALLMCHMLLPACAA